MGRRGELRDELSYMAAAGLGKLEEGAAMHSSPRGDQTLGTTSKT